MLYVFVVTIHTIPSLMGVCSVCVCVDQDNLYRVQQLNSQTQHYLGSETTFSITVPHLNFLSGRWGTSLLGVGHANC